jgi:predicted nucleotide-binding protein (sugar kinase/HSP70/actin superfamily)
VKKEKPLYYGSRCEKYEVDRHAKQTRDLPDLFEEREKLLHCGPRDCGLGIGDCGLRIEKSEIRNPKSEIGESAIRNPQSAIGKSAIEKSAIRNPQSTISKGRVGIPMALSFHDVLPFWRAFFEALGFEVALSGPTTKFTVQRGVETVVNETCFPVKVAQGHILQLLDQKPDILFLPSLIDARTEEFGPKDRPVFNCPLVQTIPYTSRSAIHFEDYAVRVLSPALHVQWGLKHMAGVLAQHGRLLGAGKREILAALEKGQAAQDAFYQALERRGQEILGGLSGGQLGLVIVSRPYNGCDLGANLDLPRKIRNLGALPIPMDMLPISRIPLPERWRKMYWRYGQRILKSAEYIKQDPNLFAVYITNFSCGPDSFVLDFFRNEMGAKPHLLLEIDEHSADAGLITRCEAFLDTLDNLARHGGARVVRTVPHVPRQFTNHRKVYLPNMSPHAYPLAAALRSVGVEAEVMAPSDDESVYWGQRHTSGRECYPCLLTTGDMVRQTRRPDFDPAKSAFLMASTDGPCRFGQYNHLQRCVLDKLGLEEVPILALEQDSEYKKVVREIGPRLERRAVTGVMVVDVLEKLLLEKRPYEENPGETEKWFWDSTHKACDVLEKKPRDIWDLLPELARAWAAIPAKTGPRRPIIGVVGEVYVRTNVFANRDLVKSIETLGGQAVVPTMGEWVHYSRLNQAIRNRSIGRYLSMLGDTLGNWVLSSDERRVYRAFERRPDPSPAEVMECARPYLDPSFQGEAILTVGKAVELIHDGAAGIINTMPFTCMPGTICAALLKRVREENGEFPMLNMSFTGQQTTNDQARLEAFIYQARAFDEKKRGETHR